MVYDFCSSNDLTSACMESILCNEKFRFPKIKCVIKILLLFPLKITHYKCSNRLSIILDKMAGNNDKLHDWS